MRYKEQFLSKKFNQEEILKGYTNNISYEEYIYYLACLSEVLYKQRKYKQALYFYDHLVKSVGSTYIIKKYEQTGKKLPSEFNKFKIDLDEFTNSKEAEALGKKIDKIAGKHATKKFIFQLIMILVGVAVGMTLFFLKVQETTCLLVGMLVAAISPLFYRPKPITLDGIIRFEHNLANVNKYNKELVDYIKNKVSKDKKYKEVNN
jgi:hypothetical protein